MRIITIAALAVVGGQALAQANVCTTGPGMPFGIRGYTCASCSVLRVDDAVTHVFGTEPTVTEVADTVQVGAPYNSAFRVGDVVTTINGKPITTREGGQDFATPRPGKNDIGIRRWDGTTLWRMMLHFQVADDCRPKNAYAMEMYRMAALAREADRVSKIPPPPQSPDPSSRIGFAVSCTPSCSKVTDKQGRTFWKHDGNPAVAVVRAGGPAAEAGLLPGDLIADVDGISVTDEAGSRKLQAYAASPVPAPDCVKCEVPVMKLGVIRNGVRREMVIELREKNSARPHGPPMSS
jgi:membrane-associated protease RseP (regulator of RpoE activity)